MPQRRGWKWVSAEADGSGKAAYLALEIDGTEIAAFETAKIAFFGGTPGTVGSAYTQTYSTADKTHADPTATTITDSSGGTAVQTIAAMAGTAADVSVAAKDAIAGLADEVNKLIADVADVKQLANSIIDDLQRLNLVG